MNVEELYEQYDVHHWLKYHPHDGHYGKYDPNVVATGFKIAETHKTFSFARSFLYDMEVDNYGQLINEHDDLHLTYIRTKLVQSALSNYNYALDLSWQVIWFYCAPNIYELIDDEDFYTSYSKACTTDKLSLKLYLGHKDGIAKHMHDFLAIETTKQLRSKYNYLKHRGAYFTLGFGEQYPTFMGSINGVNYKQLTMPELDLDQWKSDLINFDIAFTDYFERLIFSLMPSGYEKTEISFFGILEYHQKRQSIQE
jgi:hypothetical protein